MAGGISGLDAPLDRFMLQMGCSTCSSMGSLASGSIATFGSSLLNCSRLGSNQLFPHWVPSHFASSLMEDPFEDWVRFHNNVIDTAVGRAT